MGPHIILDKSALEALSANELAFLIKHYSVNIVPVLVAEILGDLSKYPGDAERSASKVAQIAKKLSPVDSIVNAHWQTLLSYSLLGGTLVPDGRPAVTGGRPLVTSTGLKGRFLDEQPEQEALHRWRAGNFSDLEASVAERWRHITRSLDLNAVRESLKRIAIGTRIGSLDALVDAARTAVADPGLQTKALTWLLAEAQIDEETAKLIWKRWEQSWPIALSSFAPFSVEVCVTLLTFYLGLLEGIVGTRSTNRVDLEYLFYLPFCYVCSTRDGTQAELARALITRGGRGQTFVHGEDLKKDLATIAGHWESLSDDEKEQNAFDYGSYPPELEGSITSALWKKYMRPWTPGSGNRAIRMSKEEKDRLLAFLGPLGEAMDKLKNDK